jgi:thiol-disulfide isomerase/thioredoxin
MNSLWKKTLVGSAVWLFGSIGCLVQAQDQPAVVSPELKRAGEAVILALSQKEVGAAFELMTEKGANQYMATMLVQLPQISQMEGAEGTESADFKELQKAVTKYGLDKIGFDMPVPDGSSKPEEIVDEMLKALDAAEERVLACIPASERRKTTTEMLTIMGKCMQSPMSLRLGEFEVNEDQAEVPVLGKVTSEVAAPDGEEPVPEMAIEYLLFVRKDGHWRFDGFNRKRMLENALNNESLALLMQPFKEIADLSIEGKTIDAEEISLAKYTGKVVLVDFWGTWCGPCVAGLPKLTELHAKYQSQGFEILGVAADDVDSLKPFLSKKPLSWKNIVDGETEIATKYSIEAFPTTLLIDKQGKHVATNLHGETLEKAIGLLLEGKSIVSITGSAQEVFDAGKKKAAEEQKLIFLHFGATWCGPCQVLEEWMSRPDIHGMLDKVFVDVKIDTGANFGAEELLTEFSPEASGIPWFAILNSTDSKPIATCMNEKAENIGFPDAAEGIDHFVKMFEATGRFSKDQLEQIRTSLKDVVEPHKAESPK